MEHAARLIVALRRLAGELSAADRDERFAVPHATISTGPIRGGVSLNIVPDECVFEVEIRLLRDAVVVCGPGDMAQGHRPDEYLEESQLHAAVLFLDRVVASLT